MRRIEPWLLAGVLGVAGCLAPGARTPVSSERLAPLVARVEAARELRFRAGVTAESVTPDGVPALIASELDRSTPPGQLRRDEALAKALGLLPADADLRNILMTWQSEAVAGFYSPIDRRLFVVEGAGGAGGGEAAGVLVHELGHALQDQHTRLLDARIGSLGNDDLQFALGAFLEGDALWTELRDESATKGFPQASGAEFAARFAVDAPDGEGVPRILRESFLAQYPLGYALAAELVQRGGVAALTAALSDPPLSSEELLHPERYLSSSARKPLAWFPEPIYAFAPEPSCETKTSTSYGELGLAVWLEEAGTSPDVASRAADGWDGDRAWLLDCRRGLLLAWVVQLDDEREARELEAAARQTGFQSPLGHTLIERRGTRLLVSSGLDLEGRRFLLERLEAQHYAGLAAVLRERPEILERAERLRRPVRY